MNDKELLQRQLDLLIKEISSYSTAVESRSLNERSRLRHPRRTYPVDEWLYGNKKRYEEVLDPNPSAVFVTKTALEALSSGQHTEKDIREVITTKCNAASVRLSSRGSLPGTNIEASTICGILLGIGAIDSVQQSPPPARLLDGGSTNLCTLSRSVDHTIKHEKDTTIKQPNGNEIDVGNEHLLSSIETHINMTNSTASSTNSLLNSLPHTTTPINATTPNSDSKNMTMNTGNSSSKTNGGDSDGVKDEPTVEHPMGSALTQRWQTLLREFFDGLPAGGTSSDVPDKVVHEPKPDVGVDNSIDAPLPTDNSITTKNNNNIIGSGEFVGMSSTAIPSSLSSAITSSKAHVTESSPHCVVVDTNVLVPGNDATPIVPINAASNRASDEDTSILIDGNIDAAVDSNVDVDARNTSRDNVDVVKPMSIVNVDESVSSSGGRCNQRDALPSVTQASTTQSTLDAADLAVSKVAADEPFMPTSHSLVPYSDESQSSGSLSVTVSDDDGDEVEEDRGGGGDADLDGRAVDDASATESTTGIPAGLGAKKVARAVADGVDDVHQGDGDEGDEECDDSERGSDDDDDEDEDKNDDDEEERGKGRASSLSRVRRRRRRKRRRLTRDSESDSAAEDDAEASEDADDDDAGGDDDEEGRGSDVDELVDPKADDELVASESDDDDDGGMDVDGEGDEQEPLDSSGALGDSFDSRGGAEDDDGDEGEGEDDTDADGGGEADADGRGEALADGSNHVDHHAEAEMDVDAAVCMETETALQEADGNGDGDGDGGSNEHSLVQTPKQYSMKPVAPSSVLVAPENVLKQWMCASFQSNFAKDREEMLIRHLLTQCGISGLSMERIGTKYLQIIDRESSKKKNRKNSFQRPRLQLSAQDLWDRALRKRKRLCSKTEKGRIVPLIVPKGVICNERVTTLLDNEDYTGDGHITGSVSAGQVGPGRRKSNVGLDRIVGDVKGHNVPPLELVDASMVARYNSMLEGFSYDELFDSDPRRGNTGGIKSKRLSVSTSSSSERVKADGHHHQHHMTATSSISDTTNIDTNITTNNDNTLTDDNHHHILPDLTIYTSAIPWHDIAKEFVICNSDEMLTDSWVATPRNSSQVDESAFLSTSRGSSRTPQIPRLHASEDVFRNDSAIYVSASASASMSSRKGTDVSTNADFIESQSAGVLSTAIATATGHLNDTATADRSVAMEISTPPLPPLTQSQTHSRTKEVSTAVKQVRIAGLGLGQGKGKGKSVTLGILTNTDNFSSNPTTSGISLKEADKEKEKEKKSGRKQARFSKTLSDVLAPSFRLIETSCTASESNVATTKDDILDKSVDVARGAGGGADGAVVSEVKSECVNDGEVVGVDEEDEEEEEDPTDEAVAARHEAVLAKMRARYATIQQNQRMRRGRGASIGSLHPPHNHPPTTHNHPVPTHPHPPTLQHAHTHENPTGSAHIPNISSSSSNTVIETVAPPTVLSVTASRKKKQVVMKAKQGKRGRPPKILRETMAMMSSIPTTNTSTSPFPIGLETHSEQVSSRDSDGSVERMEDIAASSMHQDPSSDHLSDEFVTDPMDVDICDDNVYIENDDDKNNNNDNINNDDNNHNNSGSSGLGAANNNPDKLNSSTSLQQNEQEQQQQEQHLQQQQQVQVSSSQSSSSPTKPVYAYTPSHTIDTYEGEGEGGGGGEGGDSAMNALQGTTNSVGVLPITDTCSLDDDRSPDTDFSLSDT